MPGRRPYASRGVPRRATTRRSEYASSRGGIAALLAVFGAIGLTVFWVVNPFAPRTPAAPAATQAAAGVSTAPGAPKGASSLQMVQVTAANPAPNVAQGPDPAPTAIPTLRQWDSAAPGVAPDPILASRLDQALAGVDGHVSVAVKDLGTGRGAVLDGDRELPAASLYKLPVLFSVFEAGLSMNEDLPITDEARSYDAGTMELGVGETLTVAEALERMVTLSDNTAAVMLGSRVGANRVNADISGLGMDTTHYSLERMTTSALDMLHYLDLLAQGKMVSPAASADMVHLLLRQRVNDRLPRLLPADVQVAHKTGNLPGTVNDVGILYGASSTVAVAALVSDTTDEASAATAIARVAQAAFTYFDDEPEVAGRPVVPKAPTRPIPAVWREPRPVPTPAPTAPPPVPSVDQTVIEPGGTPTPGTVHPTQVPAPATAVAVQPTPAPTLVPTLAPTARPSPPPQPATATPVPQPPTPTPAPPKPTAAPTRPAPPATPTPPNKR